MSDARKQKGDTAEELARKFLEKEGYRILKRNYRCRMGEIDLIARDRKTIVFVEVRSKTGGQFGTPLESITPAKQLRLARTAQFYFQQTAKGDQLPDGRFDVVSVSYDEGPEPPQIDHIQNAFEWPEGLWQ